MLTVTNPTGAVDVEATKTKSPTARLAFADTWVPQIFTFLRKRIHAVDMIKRFLQTLMSECYISLGIKLLEILETCEVMGNFEEVSLEAGEVTKYGQVFSTVYRYLYLGYE